MLLSKTHKMTKAPKHSLKQARRRDAIPRARPNSQARLWVLRQANYASRRAPPELLLGAVSNARIWQRTLSKSVLGGDTGAPTKRQKIYSNNNALRRAKIQSSTRILGPTSVLAIEVFGRVSQSRTSSGGVAIEVAQLRPRALVNCGAAMSLCPTATPPADRPRGRARRPPQAEAPDRATHRRAARRARNHQAISQCSSEMRASVGWRERWLVCLPAVRRPRRRSSPSLDGDDCGAARRLGDGLGKIFKLRRCGPGSGKHQKIAARVRGKGRCAFRPRAPRDACDYPRI